MNAHQRYAANAVASCSPEEMAARMADPKGNRSKSPGPAELLEWVTTYALAEVGPGLADLLASAAACKPKDVKNDDWVFDIMSFLGKLPVFPVEEHQAEVTQIGQAA